METLISQEWIEILMTAKKQSPHDPPHNFQETEETDEEPAIPYPKIDLNSNHKTPK